MDLNKMLGEMLQSSLVSTENPAIKTAREWNQMELSGRATLKVGPDGRFLSRSTAEVGEWGTRFQELVTLAATEFPPATALKVAMEATAIRVNEGRTSEPTANEAQEYVQQLVDAEAARRVVAQASASARTNDDVAPARLAPDIEAAIREIVRDEIGRAHRTAID